MAITARGVPYPVGGDNNDGPAAFLALAGFVNDNPGVHIFTTTQRDALAGGDLWTGRVIYNSTIGRLEWYDGTSWGPAWTAYTPTWSGTLGNGTLTGRYTMVGKTVNWRATVTWGSTTSHAAATQTLTLPVAPHADYTVNFPVASGMVHDFGLAVYTCHVAIQSGSTVALFRESNNLVVTNTAPITFATSDQLLINGTYEAA